MKQAFTQLQLTRLVYGETTKAERDMLLELALTIPQVGEDLLAMQSAKNALEDNGNQPSERTINRILAYSAATAPVAAN